MDQPIQRPKISPPSSGTPHNQDDQSAGQHRELQTARDVALLQINLIYDALDVIHSMSSPASRQDGESSSANAPAFSCEQIDIAVRDSLIELLDDISWILSTYGNADGAVLNIQAKLLLQLLDESGDTPAGALAHSIAAKISA